MVAQFLNVIRYNSRQFSRIYPKGTRVDSTNYNPQVFDAFLRSSFNSVNENIIYLRLTF